MSNTPLPYAWLPKGQWEKMTAVEDWFTATVYSEDQGEHFECLPLYLAPPSSRYPKVAPYAATTTDYLGCEYMSHDVAGIEKIAGAGSMGPTEVTYLYAGSPMIALPPADFDAIRAHLVANAGRERATFSLKGISDMLEEIDQLRTDLAIFNAHRHELLEMVQSAPRSLQRFRNRVDGKTYEFVSADGDMVTFKREGRNTLRYLCRSEFDNRFELLPSSPFHVVGSDVFRQALLDIRNLVRTDTTDGLDEAKDIAEAALNAPSETVLNPHTVGLSIVELQRAHVERQEEWCPDQKPDLSFRGNELGGECGEAQNVIKKLERERHGWRGSRDTVEHLAEELGDVIHCAILCAITAGIDLEPAVIAKFNNTSEKNGLATKLRAAIASVEGADND